MKTVSTTPAVPASFDTAYALARRAAGVRARGAVASGAIQRADREDLEQEAVVACWLAMANFDARRASLPTFIECVVASRMASVVRATHHLRALRSLDRAADLCAASMFSGHELRIDIERLLEDCSDSERRLARLLTEYSPTQASRILGVARSTVYERIRGLRMRFAPAGPKGQADLSARAHHRQAEIL